MFGYEIHILVFGIVLGVIALIVGAIFFLKRKKNDGDTPSLSKNIRNKQEQRKTQNISNWQKKYLPQIIDKEIENNNFDDDDSRAYVSILEQVKAYIAAEKEWNPDKILAINENILVVLNDLFISNAIEFYGKGDNDSAVLLVHTIDCMHGTIANLNNRFDWITNEVPKLEICALTSDVDKRVAYVAYNAVEQMKGFINPITHKVQRDFDLIDALKEYSESRFKESQNSLTNAKSLANITEYDREVIVYCLFERCRQVISEMPLTRFREFEIFPFRVLACFIDNQSYNDVLATIE